MIALLQRVSQARVLVNQNVVGEIDRGILAFIGVEKNDGASEVKRLTERVLSYRLFSDEEGKMNLDVQQSGGALLLVPQFTLAANTNKGNRASFTSAAPPEIGERLFNDMVKLSKQSNTRVATGQFGAHMEVSLVNDGPVTFWLQVTPDDS
jgi:D-tyrosyl-tRNA(Tyr) deacylase